MVDQILQHLKRFSLLPARTFESPLRARPWAFFFTEVCSPLQNNLRISYLASVLKLRDMRGKGFLGGLTEEDKR